MMTSSVEKKFTHRPKTVKLDADEARQRLKSVDAGLLLPIAVHVTRDTTLVDKYVDRVALPKVRQMLAPVSDEAQIDADEQASIHSDLTELIVDVLSSDDQEEYLTGGELADTGAFQRLVDRLGGDPIVEPKNEYDLYLNQSGFEVDEISPRKPEATDRKLKVAIIGAGMQGIDAAMRSMRYGYDYEIYEKMDGVGGLWWSQRYPGVAVDTQSLAYSLSWNQTPDWSRFYPKGEEYQAYLEQISADYGITEKINFGHEVIKMEWQEEDHEWEITLFLAETGETKIVRADAVISAAGLLSRPKYPDIDGRETFQGEQVHSVRWRDVDYTGKKVAIVGTGAAAVQVIYSVAPDAGHLTIFQRQPGWIQRNPHGEGVVGEDEAWVIQNIPYFMQWTRLVSIALINKAVRSISIVDEEWFAEHPYSISEGSEAIRQQCLAYIDETIGLDTELGRKVTPKFTFGAKRPVTDPGDFNNQKGYYYSLTQPHVDLDDGGVSRVVPQGILTGDGRLVEADVIIWASGMTLDYLSQIKVVGREGKVLSHFWKGSEDPRSYFGGAVIGFPNLFVMDGTGSGAALGGTGAHTYIAEMQNHFAFETLQHMVNSGATSIEIDEDVFWKYQEFNDERLDSLIWGHDKRANTYYMNSAGRVILPNPLWPHETWDMTRNVRPEVWVLKTADEIETS